MADTVSGRVYLRAYTATSPDACGECQDDIERGDRIYLVKDREDRYGDRDYAVCVDCGEHLRATGQVP